nr:MAG TPA: hypothetical protein [Caudoviricetes sp.]
MVYHFRFVSKHYHRLLAIQITASASFGGSKDIIRIYLLYHLYLENKSEHTFFVE